MAKKKDEEKELTEEPIFEPKKKAPPAYTGPVPGTVVLVNLTPAEVDVTLLDGTNLAMGPRVKGRTFNRSRPVLKKVLPRNIRKAVAAGKIRLEEVTQ